MIFNSPNRLLLIVLLAALFAASCGTPATRTDNNPPKANGNTTAQTNSGPEKTNSSDDAGAQAEAEKKTTGSAVAKAACMTVNVGKRAVQKSQTFAIDFQPFDGSCFVTTYNPEYGDSHMESEYAIYKSGKKVFDFPDQFNGSTFGCWVDAVAFQDLNRDGLTDAIVVGKCAAKAGDYNENMVYVNTGKAFTTREDGNNKLNDLKTIKEISDFVQDNQQIFF
jgi:hypothetical protein